MLGTPELVLSRVTGKPQVISSPIGVSSDNALVLTGLATFRLVRNSEVLAFPKQITWASVPYERPDTW